MTSFSALAPVSAGIFAALNVAALTALAPGGVFDDVPQNTVYPFVLYSVTEKRQGGFGTKPGTGQLPEIDLRVHVYSQYAGYQEAETVMAKVIELLKDPPAVAGYSSWAIFHDETLTMGDTDIAGLKVKEVAANFRLYVEAP